jgi:DMSO/TMAO reductase YedYZ molybdopterin-dependent catalytic subunit
MRAAALLSLALAAAAVPAAAESLEPIGITGMVHHDLALTQADLAALPQQTVQARFQTMHGIEDHHWTGPLLWTLLARAGLRDEPGPRTAARHAILVTGSDGYAATIAIGEIDPALEGKQVILATATDGPPLSAPKLIVPGDRHGARDVHDVVSIMVR